MDQIVTNQVLAEYVKERSLAFRDTDAAAVRAIAQAAVSVELFTIPLYMTTLYSIEGMHEINSKGTDYYLGRRWPGLATTANPGTPNEQAFNIIFSVFIQEMLHLQLASNIASAIGQRPDFTDPALQSKEHGWTCYGPDKTVIPHIIDLTDTTPYANTKVNVGPLNKEQIELFIAIEEPEKAARDRIVTDRKQRYFPQVPFAGWQAGDDLPLFGTIGWMYDCLAHYLAIEYTDGTTLWDYVYDDQSVQRDMFNISGKGTGHPLAEFPQIAVVFDKGEAAQDAFSKARQMMSAITDQGEGSSLKLRLGKALAQNLMAVKEKYRPSEEALEADYPSFDAKGQPIPSRDAAARYPNSKPDHYERFIEIRDKLLKDVSTWEQWHAKGNTWTEADLTTDQYDPHTAHKNVPAPKAVADALNALKTDDKNGENYALLSHAVVGAIAGVTTVLDKYWSVEADDTFPYPSMAGSGDRMAIAWAVFGKTPDLRSGLGKPEAGRLYHACQGMNLDPNFKNGDPAVEIYHTCRGSNGCHAQGGCGFVQSTSGGGSCGAVAKRTHAPLQSGNKVLCGGPTPPKGLYSAPSDNKCATFGGCAVPISASQLFPKAGEMQLFNFKPANPKPPKPEPVSYKSVPIGEPLRFEVGDSVFATAWAAYREVLKARGEQDPGDAPAASNIRLAFPPST